MTFCDPSRFSSVLNRIFRENGFSSLLSAEVTDRFCRLTERMLTVNGSFNLTAITDPEKIVLLHYADCAALAARLPRGASVVDVGCGAGFPTLPVAILRPDVSILAMDSTAKKVEYVRQTAELLGLTGVTCRTARAEDAAQDAALRGRFDVATARAVAELRVLTELCLPFVRVGGIMLAMKGKNAAAEVSAARRAIAMLGGKFAGTDEVSLTGGEESVTHPILRIDKIAPTPAAYPRPYAKIVKKPL